MKQILQRADELRIACCRFCGLEVCPSGRNQRLTSIRKNQKELHAAMPVGASENLQRLPLKRVMGTRDRYPFWKVPTVGSVWWFPSIT